MDVSSFNISGVTKHITWMNACKAGSFLLAAHMVQIGVWAYTSPRSLCRAFHLHFDGKPSANSSLHNRSNTEASDEKEATIHSEDAKKDQHDGNQAENYWPLLFAPREVGFGLTILALGSMGEWKAVGVVVATVGGLLATTDGVVAGLYTSGGWPEAAKSHGLPGLLIGLLAIPLIRIETA